MEKRAERLLQMFDIDKICKKYPAEISGGQKQRTAVARALINDPLMILADEPTGNLDRRSSEAVIEAFVKAKNELQATILMVTHDSLSASYCDRECKIDFKDGQFIEALDISTIFGNLLDNAIEACVKMPESERLIWINDWKKKAIYTCSSKKYCYI